VKLKQFYWGKINDRLAGQTVWPSEILPIPVPDEAIPEKEIEGLFPASKPKVISNLDKPKKDNKPKTISLIDPQRGNNLSIVLSQFKLSGEEIAAAICDVNNEIITAERIESLVKYVPEREEIETIKAFDGDVNLLGPAEKYFIAVLPIPDLEAKFNAMTFKLEFDEMYQDTSNLLNNVEKGLKDCNSSEAFQTALKYILEIGNFLNYKTRNGNAKAFKLTSLRKLRDARSTTNNKITLLHFIVDTFDKIDEVKGFGGSLESLELAAKVPLSKIKQDVNGMSRSMAEIKATLEREPAEIEEKYFSVMKEFAAKCDEDVATLKKRLEDLEKQCVEFTKKWGEDPSAVPVEEVLGEIVFFIGDYEKAKEENEKRRALEAKRKAMEEKKKQKMGGKKTTEKAPEKNQFGREMGPLDMLFSNINSGNFNLKKVETVEK